MASTRARCAAASTAWARRGGVGWRVGVCGRGGWVGECVVGCVGGWVGACVSAWAGACVCVRRARLLAAALLELYKVTPRRVTQARLVRVRVRARVRARARARARVKVRVAQARPSIHEARREGHLVRVMGRVRGRGRVRVRVGVGVRGRVRPRRAPGGGAGAWRRARRRTSLARPSGAPPLPRPANRLRCSSVALMVS